VLPNFESGFLLSSAFIVAVLGGELAAVLMPLIFSEEIVSSLEIALLNDLANDIDFAERLFFRGIN
jgi:hypothetical protein